jgi:hypothetical protein
MTEFRAGDLVYWIFPNSDKGLCTVKDILSDGRLRVIWHKDNFINVMPRSGFVSAEDYRLNSD